MYIVQQPGDFSVVPFRLVVHWLNRFFQIFCLQSAPGAWRHVSIRRSFP